jgi:hypothetical protein
MWKKIARQGRRRPWPSARQSEWEMGQGKDQRERKVALHDQRVAGGARWDDSLSWVLVREGDGKQRLIIGPTSHFAMSFGP